MNIRESIIRALQEQCFAYGPNGALGNYGCMDPVALNYDSFATHPCNALGPSIACADCYGNSDWCGPGTAPYGDCCQYPVPILGCTDINANNYDASANTDDGSCTYDILGCTDPTACNETFNATIDDGSCTYPGCTDPLANNYDPIAGCDDNSCTYDILGCTDSNAINYDPTANVDDNSCTYPILGCTDLLALNYDPFATVDDGSCVYEAEPEDCSNQLDIGCWVCKDPINFPGCQQITNMTQVTLATGYGLIGFGAQQDCINSTECGGMNILDGPCNKLENYVLINYPNWQGGGPLDVIHFCENCKYNGLNDPMCKCCEKDPCDKSYLMDKLQQVYNLELPEFCKYCKSGNIQDISCKCCKRFQKDKKKDIIGEEIKRIKELLK